MTFMYDAFGGHLMDQSVSRNFQYSLIVEILFPLAWLRLLMSLLKKLQTMSLAGLPSLDRLWL